MFEAHLPTKIQQIKSSVLDQHEVKLFLKREDEIDHEISGNKFRKLKYNLISAIDQNFETLLTFGGAYSNHIHAVSAVGKKFNLNTIGIIRGERNDQLNPTLKDAENNGMQLKFVDRQTYREKNSDLFKKLLEEEFGRFYFIPEGGSNELAVKGCEEIADEISEEFDWVCCSVGTGGTISGLINGLKGKARVLGFPALKNAYFLEKEIKSFLEMRKSNVSTGWQLSFDYHFGGYAKYSWDLIHFINEFKEEHGVQLDPIYTGKMIFGIIDLAKNDFFAKDVKVLAIHTGGLQGIRGFNERFGQLIHV